MATKLNVRNTQSRDGDTVWKTVDQFYQTYWSGLDCRIFANQVLIGEIIELQWSLQEAVAPLFGYHDYVYSTIMHGARRVNGAFKINFVREAYLFELLSTLNTKPSIGDTGQPTSLRRTDAFEAAVDGRADISYLLGLASADGTTPTDNSGRPRLSKDQFNRVANDFEKAIWGKQSPNDPTTINNNRVRSTVKNLLEETSSKKARFELDNRFDLRIIFGSVEPGPAQQQQLAGLAGRNKEKTVIPVATNTTLTGVAITGNERVIDDSGRPIMEAYQFIARDVL